MLLLPTSLSLINGFFHNHHHHHHFHRLWCLLLLIFSFLLTHSTTTASSPDSSSFIYVGCSPIKCTPNSPYSSNLNSLLTSLLNSASYSYYNNFTTTTTPTIYGLFQCRPDLPNCATCVSTAVTQLTTVLCANSVGASIQLDGCYVRYDNTTFLGVEDKSVVECKCGPNGAAGSYGDVLSVMNGLMVVGDHGQQQRETMFRVRQSGDVRGVAQCVGDLSLSQCQDCLKDAVQQLKNGCGMAISGDVFLAKCYARFFVDGSHTSSGQGSGNGGESIRDSETQKTLAILIGIIAAVALLVIFLAFLRKLCEGKGGK